MAAFGVGSMQGGGVTGGQPMSSQGPSEGDFILVYFLEHQAVGKEFARTRDTWPLHITLVTWFVAPAARQLVADLDAIIPGLRPFEAVLGKEEQFAEDTRVTLVKNQADVQRLHDTLAECVQTAAGEIRDKRWIGDRYTAHVTHHASEKPPRKGTRLDVTEFSLVRLLPGDTCGVARNFHLGVER
ncbi:MAG: 2'-5' RNA ligase family protein [Candidatus Saccharibacteria bacterium]